MFIINNKCKLYQSLGCEIYEKENLKNWYRILCRKFKHLLMYNSSGLFKTVPTRGINF